MIQIRAAHAALPWLLVCVLLGTCALASGCATQPGAKKDPRDPIEPFNRAMFKFDDGFYKVIAHPVGKAYTTVTPKFVQTGIANVFDNAHMPIVIVNDLLQGKLKASLADTGRLVMNTTIGIGGLLDAASDAGLPKNDNDFGRTLGTWGLHPGAYLMLPFFGPSDLRDGAGRIVDGFGSPQNYIKDNTARWTVYGVYLLDTDARDVIPQYELLNSQNVYDRYAFLRSVYLQRREYLIHGGNPESEDQQEKELENSVPEDDTAAPAAKPPAATPPAAPPPGTSPPK
ncbi:MAG TPA: VacJ family lipoprotein [Steroidobacteraceae bacterium]|nr:VacJ family lipoprotein [Steroidobacteraceae bacterium]